MPGGLQSRLAREQLQGMRMRNAQTAMDMFSPTRDLQDLGLREHIRGQQLRNDGTEQFMPIELQQAIARLTGIEHDNRGADLRNQLAERGLANYDNDRANAQEGQQLQQLAAILGIQDTMTNRRYAEEDRGYQADERAYQQGERAYQQQQREELAPLNKSLMQNEALKTMLGFFGDLDFSPTVTDLASQIGLAAPVRRQQMMPNGGSAPQISPEQLEALRPVFESMMR